MLVIWFFALLSRRQEGSCFWCIKISPSGRNDGCRMFGFIVCHLDDRRDLVFGVLRFLPLVKMTGVGSLVFCFVISTTGEILVVELRKLNNIGNCYDENVLRLPVD